MRDAPHRAIRSTDVTQSELSGSCAVVDIATPSSDPLARSCVKLTRQELSRKLWHMSAGLLPFLVPLLPYYYTASDFWGVAGVRMIVLGTAATLMTVSLVYSNRFARPSERSVAKAMSCYALPVIIPLLLFPSHLELGLTVLAIVAIGDGAAGLMGMSLQGPRLFWNQGKTITGTLGFLLFGIPVATAAYWVSAQTAVTWTNAASLVTAAALVAAFAESFPSSIDDNLRVGTAAAVVLAAQRMLTMG